MLADDDAFLTVALDPNRRLDFNTCVVLGILLDLHRQTVRYLLPQIEHQFLANDFRRAERSAAVGDHVPGIKRFRFGQKAGQHVAQRLDVVSFLRGNRHHLCKLVTPGHFFERLQQHFLRVNLINFIQ